MSRRFKSMKYQSDSQLSRGPSFLMLSLCLLAGLLLLVGCTNLGARDQRVVSGAAIGGAIACWPGAAIGAGVGYLVGLEDEQK